MHPHPTVPPPTAEAATKVTPVAVGTDAAAATGEPLDVAALTVQAIGAVACARPHVRAIDVMVPLETVRRPDVSVLPAAMLAQPVPQVGAVLCTDAK